jgi:hypothetical protein
MSLRILRLLALSTRNSAELCMLASNLSTAMPATAVSAFTCHRSFAADGGEPSEPAPLEAGDAPPADDAPAATAAPEADGGTPVDPLTAALQSLSPRQRAWARPDPEGNKHFLPRLSRKEVGSYADPASLEEFEEEVGWGSLFCFFGFFPSLQLLLWRAALFLCLPLHVKLFFLFCFSLFLTCHATSILFAV